MKKNELLDENLTLRKKVERLTTKNRSLEVLSDDLKSLELQITSSAFKTKNNSIKISKYNGQQR